MTLHGRARGIEAVDRGAESVVRQHELDPTRRGPR